MQNRILAIGAHPDDIEYAIAMTLRQHVLKNDEVFYAVCSDGEKGGDSGRRIKECEEASKFMGVKDLYLLKLPDTRIPVLKFELVDKLEEIEDKLSPDLVLTHTSKDRHQDHSAVSEACSIAFRKVPNIYHYRSPSTTSEFIPHLFSVGTEEDLEFKINLLKIFETQIERGLLDLEAVRAEALVWGRTHSPYRKQYAEPLVVNHAVYGIGYLGLK